MPSEPQNRPYTGNPWEVEFHDDFDEEFSRLHEDVQALLQRLGVLAEFGPTLGRPLVDTLRGSDYTNMKELRFNCDSVWQLPLPLIL